MSLFAVQQTDAFSMQWLEGARSMLPVLLFLFGVVFGASISWAIEQLADWRERPTVDGTPDSVQLWHRENVIRLTPDATRHLAKDLLGRAEEIDLRTGRSTRRSRGQPA